MRLHKEPTSDQTLDTLGTYCPIPVIRTARVMAEMKHGQVLQLLSDDRGVLVDIPDWCSGHGHEFLGYVSVDHAYRLYLRKVVR